VDHDYDDYKSKPADLRMVYHLALALFHLRDWTFWEHRASPSFPHKTLAGYQAYLEQQCSYFGYMRDLANAVKHAELDKPSTQMVGLADTAISSAAFSFIAFQNDSFQTKTVIVSKTTPNECVDFEKAADAVMAMWNDIFSANQWK
jgi:hypothetical protein